MHKQIKKEDNQVICFVGLGVLFKNCYDSIVENIGFKPNFLFDNSKDKWGTLFNNIVCLNEKEFKNIKKNSLMVICIRNYESISKQLENLGFNNIFVVKFERGIDRVRKIENINNIFPKIKRINSNNKIDLEGRWALVTGSSRGIGCKIAKELSKLGVNLLLHASKKNIKNTVESDCKKNGVECISIHSDFSKINYMDKFLNWLKFDAPTIDIAYCNAGISIPAHGGFWETPISDYELSFRVNALSCVKITQTILPGMISRNFGRIIFTSSSIQKRPNEMAYAISKAALDKFVYDLYPSLGDKDVMLSLLDPGWIKTDMGGSDATEEIDSLYPGILIPALINGNVNGKWITVQDYKNYSLEEALFKAFSIENIV